MRAVTYLTLSCLATGCWDVTELNERAIVIGSAIDLGPKDGVRITEQIVIPQGPKATPGSTGKNFFVVSATGINWIDAFQNLQAKLSRQIYLSHRRTVYIGEWLAKRGIGPYLDELSRNPDSRLRTDLIVVKGADAKDVMTIVTPLEKLPSSSIEGILRFVGVTQGRSLLECLIAAASPTASPAIPEIRIKTGVKKSDQTLNTIEFSGFAVFNKKLQLVGDLNYEESIARLWLTRSLGHQYMTVALPPPIGGYASLNFTTFRTRLTPRIDRNHQLSMQVLLSATAAVIENDSPLNLKTRKALRRLEVAMDTQVATRTRQSIRRVQQDMGADIYGFDEACQQTFPKQWGAWKRRWPTIFAGMNVQVACNVTILTTGATGRPLGLPDTAITNTAGGQ